MNCDCNQQQVLEQLGQVLAKNNRTLLDGLDDLMVLITVNLEVVKDLSPGLHDKCLYLIRKHMEVIEYGQ